MLKSPLFRRALWMLLALCMQCLYFPINAAMKGGIAPRTSLDVFPIIPVWSLPYVLCYPLWIFSIFWVVLKLEAPLFEAVIAACLSTFSAAMLTFVLYPTYVVPPPVAESGFFADLLRFVHLYAGGYNAFPSGHVYITTLIALFFSRAYPPQKWMWTAVVVLVSLSTLFTGQHYVADVAGGWLFAFCGYRLGLRWADLLPASKEVVPPVVRTPD